MFTLAAHSVIFHRYILLFCTLCILLITGRVLAQTDAYPYKIKSLTVDDGLSHTDANDIAQDGKGFIWVATNFGLTRFDGNAVRQLYNKNEPLKNAYKNRIDCIYPDQAGDIWLGTEGGLQRFEVKTERYVNYHCETQALNNLIKIYKPSGDKIYALGGRQLMLFEMKDTALTELKIPIPANVLVSDFLVDDRGLLLVTNNGLMILDKKNRLHGAAIAGTKVGVHAYDHIARANGNRVILTSNDEVFLIAPVKDSRSGLYNYTVERQYTSPSHRKIRNVTCDAKRSVWVNDGGRLMHLDKDLNLKQVISSKSPLQTLNSNSLTKIFVDRSQCMWVCMFGGGVNYFDLNEKPFYTLRHVPGYKNSLSGSYVRCVLADGGDLWVGTADSGLDCYNKKSHTFSFYNTYDSPVRLKNDAITALTLDKEGALWIGSDKGIEILDRQRKKIVKPSGWENFPKYAIEVLVTDVFGNIWFGNHTDQFGVVYKDVKGIYRVKYYGEGFFILADSAKARLMVSSTHGLKMLSIDKEGNVLSAVTYTASNKPNSLSSNYTYPIVKQGDNTYWVGTIGGGLNRIDLGPNNTYKISVFDGRYGIFNDVESLELDNNGNLWMGGNGLQRFNPATKKLTRYDKNDGLQGNSFKVGSSYKGADGCMYFGGINGLNYFYPQQIHENTVPATPIITDILINNQRPAIFSTKPTENSISQSVSYSSALQISYKQNNFVIFFSAMHFANPLKCRYRYKLSGFDKEWRYTDGKTPSAAYNNIDYADYTFRVQASNDDGIWSNQTAQLDIVVSPPWYKTVLAKVFYAIVFVSMLLGIYIYQARWHTLKRDIEIGKINEQRREEIHQQREELHQQQLVFFTNISHEFRTPLTLIVGPLEHLIHENKDIHLNSTYQLILRNAKRLMNLIAELMNFKKVADSVIRLQVRPLDVVQFCTGIYSEFENVALSKDISYRFVNSTKTSGNDLTGWFDVQVLEKILFNLLNNAFKYTENNGEVTLEIFFDLDAFKPSFPNEFKLLNPTRAEKYLYIRVADTGIGISPESIASIFERYYRISGSHIGSGVGLALVKSLTQLHKGDIYVYSERIAGTEIIIGIPWGENNYDTAEKMSFTGEVKSQLEPVDHSLLTIAAQSSLENEAVGSRSDKRILIVEDNIELRRFLIQVFDKYYNIYEAGDGEQGLKLALEKIPDVIISDVMMPKMNGIELCKVVKERFETRHIPFIILSAKDAIDAHIEGMEFGADFYFAKPLSIDLLLLTIRNIFSQREVAKQRFINDYLSNATELVQSEVDQEFFDKLIGVIEKNIQNTDMDVDFLCKRLFVSRTKLYQKIKSISGQSVGEFIRTVRLKKSIEIMTHENVSMNEVAERIGMQSSSNFSRTFKKEFGKSPLQFMQSLKKS